MSSNLGTKAIAIAIITLVVGVVVGYAVGGMGKVTPEELQATTTELNNLKAQYQTLTQQFNTLQTNYQSLNSQLQDLKAFVGPLAQKLKVGFIYVGPIGDYGWTNAHDYARQYVEKEFPWVQTTYVESVAAADGQRIADQLIAAGNQVIFTTSFDFLDSTDAAAKEAKNSNVTFFHCSGYIRHPNEGTYMADFYQVYYLCGLMAGTLTKTGKIGYVSAYPIPECVRHINAFALGVKETNPNAKVYVRWIFNWYDPVKAREASEALLSEGVDTFAFTEDSPTVVQVAEEATNSGKQTYVFSHYSPMLSYGPNSVVSGQLVHWEKIYEDIIMKLRLGIYNYTNLQNVDYLWNLKEGGVELACGYGIPINPKFEADLKAKMINDPIFGPISVYDLVNKRMAQMKDANIGFDPFTGPIRDQSGNLKIEAGRRATIDELFSDKMNWFVDNVVGSPSG